MSGSANCFNSFPSQLKPLKRFEVSRSDNTRLKPGVNETAPSISCVILEAGGQFLPRHGRGPELADDDRAAVIGDLRGFGRRRVAGESQRKKSDGRIARAGNIEDLARFGRNMMGSALSFEKASSRVRPA